MTRSSFNSLIFGDSWPVNWLCLYTLENGVSNEWFFKGSLQWGNKSSCATNSFITNTTTNTSNCTNLRPWKLWKSAESRRHTQRSTILEEVLSQVTKSPALWISRDNVVCYQEPKQEKRHYYSSLCGSAKAFTRPKARGMVWPCVAEESCHRVVTEMKILGAFLSTAITASALIELRRIINLSGTKIL